MLIFKNFYLVLGLLFLGVFFLTACSYNIETDVIIPVEKNESNNIINEISEIKEFSFIARQWEFTPSVIEVNEGDIVKIKIESLDVEHGFTIAELGVSEKIKGGETKEFSFVASKKGEFTFFCSVFCGEGHRNMKGRLIVNPRQ